MIIKDPKQKKRMDKVPDRDKHGDPIFKIAVGGQDKKPKPKDRKAK